MSEYFIKYYLIKLNSEENRKKGFGWILLKYKTKDLSDEPVYINAKQVNISTVCTTFVRDNQYFMKTEGELVGYDGEYNIV